MSEATCQHPLDLTALVFEADIPTAVGTEVLDEDLHLINSLHPVNCVAFRLSIA